MCAHTVQTVASDDHLGYVGDFHCLFWQIFTNLHNKTVLRVHRGREYSHTHGDRLIWTKSTIRNELIVSLRLLSDHVMTTDGHRMSSTGVRR